MIRTYKYLLRPNKQQADMLEILLDHARQIYNLALEERLRVYSQTGKTIRYFDQRVYFRDLRNSHPESFGKLSSQTVNEILRQLDKSYSSFFRKKQAGKTAGLPRLKARGEYSSLDFTYGASCKLGLLPNGKIYMYLRNVGNIRVSFHRSLPSDVEIKRILVKKSELHWYACVVAEFSSTPIVCEDRGEIGIDVGLHYLLAFSDGTIIENPRWLRMNLDKVKALQRRASKCKKGSHRQAKIYGRVAKIHEKISNQRRDFLHKISRIIVQNNSLIGLERFSLSFLNQNKRQALSSYDAAIGIFRRFVQYKAEETGGKVVLVDQAMTSQMCSQCGEIVVKDLSTRTHRCPHCGLTMDRDVNAARNILKKAIKNSRLDEAVR